ncbi:hypothetical protein ACFQPG_10905 [Sphingomonas sp. GCM10030256]|uniref:hypothetical protein n=1 Tax=Sphingomonas sp. GCM10030256 TaxID=3273427 RepID=UPI00361E9851
MEVFVRRFLEPVSWCSLSMAFAAVGYAAPAVAAGTPAGTTITNTAKATFDLPGGGSADINSNPVNILVDELLDVSVASLNGGTVTVTPSASNQVLMFQVTNAGNGSERFRLIARDTLAGDDFDPTTTSIVLDSNGNSIYDPGTDTVYTAGSNDPVLAQDASVTVFVLSSIPATVTDGQQGRVELQAIAVTGSGTAGTIFADQGQGGGDAVVGATTAQGLGSGLYAVSAASVSFVKSASVLDPFGGTSQVPGAVITYSLTATVNGSGNLKNLVISDSVPTGTVYEPNSLTLSGAALTDAADGDSGEIGASGIAVRLGDVAGGNVRTVTFKVKVN